MPNLWLPLSEGLRKTYGLVGFLMSINTRVISLAYVNERKVSVIDRKAVRKDKQDFMATRFPNETL